MKKVYPSKKKKRRAEYLERKTKRESGSPYSFAEALGIEVQKTSSPTLTEKELNALADKYKKNKIKLEYGNKKRYDDVGIADLEKLKEIGDKKNKGGI